MKSAFSIQQTCDSTIDPSQINSTMIEEINMNYANKVFFETGIDKIILEAHEKFPKVSVEVIKAFISASTGNSKLRDTIEKSIKDSNSFICGENDYCGLMKISKEDCKQHKNICSFKEIKKGNISQNILTGTAKINDLLEEENLENPDYLFLALSYKTSLKTKVKTIEITASRTKKQKELIQWKDITEEDLKSALKETKNKEYRDNNKVKEILSFSNSVGSALVQECGANTLNPPSRNFQNNILFKPKTKTLENINLDYLDLVNVFVERIKKTCGRNSENCIKEQIKKFNDENKGKIKIISGFEEDKLVGDVLSQILEYLNSDQENCLAKININYGLDHKYDIERLRFKQSGVVELADAENILATNEYFMSLPVSLTKSYTSTENENDYIDVIIDTRKNTTTLLTDLTWNSISEIFQNFFQGATIWSTEKTLYTRHIDDIAFLKTRTLSATETNDLIGPSAMCIGNEKLPSTRTDRVQEPAWNSGGKSYAELAVEISQESGVDPALLITHAILESNLGKQNSCTAKGKTSLTGCGWYPSCSKDCSCTSSQGWETSDEAQLNCTANTDKHAYEQATGLKDSGHYTKCQQYSSDPEKMWTCIFCVYQGNYDKDVTNSGKPYFTRDGTCSYAENFKKIYCSWKQYFEQRGFATAYGGGGACQSYVDYAEKYLGTSYGGTGPCTAEQAQAKKCTTQCGSFVTNVFRFGDPNNKVLIYGNGNQKCDQEETKDQKFDDPNLLQPGDIFSSDGPSEAAKIWGHTGIFVGKGRVSGDARFGTKKAHPSNPYCYSKFIPDSNGEPVFIHSVGPVCYSTLDQLKTRQRRNIYSFCRPNVCGSLQQKPNQQNKESTSNLKESKESISLWIPYTEEYKQLLCRSGKNNYLFSAEFPFTDKKLNFALFVENKENPEINSFKIQEKLCGAQPTLLASWSVPKNTKTYSFTLSFAREKSLEQIEQSIDIFTSTEEETTLSKESLRTKNKLFVDKSGSLENKYYYLFSPSERFEGGLIESEVVFANLEAENNFGAKNEDEQWQKFIMLNASIMKKFKGSSPDDFVVKASSSCMNNNEYSISALMAILKQKDIDFKKQQVES